MYIMILNKQLLLAVMVALSLMLASCKSEDINTVGQVGNSVKIDFDELNTFFQEVYYYKQYDSATIEDYEIALNEMLINKIKLMDFFESGFHKDSLLTSGIQRMINEELVIFYYNNQYLSKYVNDKAVKDLYNQINREVIYRMISFPKKRSADDDEIENKFHQMLEELKHGESFPELAAKFSKYTTAGTEGELTHSLTWKGNMDRMSAKIFQMKPDDIQAFENKSAYSIVQIDKVNKISIAPYEELEDAITAQLKNDYTNMALMEYNSEFKESIDTSDIRWNPLFFDQLSEWLIFDESNGYQYNREIEDSIRHGRNIVIAEYSDGQVDLHKLDWLMNDILLLNSEEYPSKQELKDYIVEALRTESIVNKARALDLEKEVLNAATKNRLIQKRLVELYEQKIVEKNMPDITEKLLYNFYLDNKDTLFFQFAKVNIYAAINSDKASAEQLLQRIDNGVSFMELMDRIFVKTFIKDHDGEIHSLYSKEKPFLGKAAFKLNLNEVTGPVRYIDPEKGVQYAIIKCMAKKPAKQLSYEEVKKNILNEFVEYERRRIIEEREKALMQKYNTKVFKEVLEKKVKEI